MQCIVGQMQASCVVVGVSVTTMHNIVHVCIVYMCNKEVYTNSCSSSQSRVPLSYPVFLILEWFGCCSENVQNIYDYVHYKSSKPRNSE